MALVHIKSDEDFKKEVVEVTGELVVVDFWATWCGPCKAYGPVFEQTATEVEGVKFAKADIDELDDVTTKLNIMGVPTTVLVKDGKVLDSKSGALTGDALKEFIDAHK